MRFQKGSKKPENSGRKKGSQNHLTKTVKETVLNVFIELQGDPKHNLLAFAKENPRDFYTIASKLIPAEVNATVEGKQVINVNVV